MRLKMQLQKLTAKLNARKRQLQDAQKTLRKKPPKPMQRPAPKLSKEEKAAKKEAKAAKAEAKKSKSCKITIYVLCEFHCMLI